MTKNGRSVRSFVAVGALHEIRVADPPAVEIILLGRRDVVAAALVAVDLDARRAAEQAIALAELRPLRAAAIVFAHRNTAGEKNRQRDGVAHCRQSSTTAMAGAESRSLRRAPSGGA